MPCPYGGGGRARQRGLAAIPLPSSALPRPIGCAEQREAHRNARCPVLAHDAVRRAPLGAPYGWGVIAVYGHGMPCPYGGAVGRGGEWWPP